MNAHFSLPSRALWPTVLFCHALLLCCAAGCVKLPRRAARVGTDNTAARDASGPRVNINHATREELERLPGVGAGLAERILEHRRRHGAFRRVEHLLAVRGISETRFEQLRAHVTVE